MRDKIFVDSNIIIYAYDIDAGAKQKMASQILKDLWGRPRTPCVSVQVLQECFVNFIRKGLSHELSSGIITDLLQWDVVGNDAALLVEGMRIKEHLRLSFWDALIIAAARTAGAGSILSEDFSHGHVYEGVKVFNPLI